MLVEEATAHLKYGWIKPVTPRGFIGMVADQMTACDYVGQNQLQDY